MSKVPTPSQLDMSSSAASARHRPARLAYLIGAAGSGMRSLARVLRGQGWTLSGSDARLDSVDLGEGLWHAGHVAEQVDPASALVIHSDAIPRDHVERRQAEALGLPTRSYPQMLAELMAGKRGVAVAGTHGKSTVTALAAHCLQESGLDPTVVFGACWRDGQPGGHAGAGDVVLVEACEYRRNFLTLAPQVAALLHVEPDHFDCFARPEKVVEAFVEFVQRLPPDGALILATDQPHAETFAAAAQCRVTRCGRNGEWQARTINREAGHSTIELRRAGRPVARARLGAIGRHHEQNALMAAALAHESGASPAAIARALESFPGLARRAERLGQWSGVELWDDYAHHPTAVRATLAAIREARPEARLVCVFEPHQASRLAALLDEFARSLQNADRAWVAPVFAARESPLPPAQTTTPLIERARALGADVDPLPDDLEALVEQLHAGDVLVTLGAGYAGKIAHGIAERLRSVCAGR